MKRKTTKKEFENLNNNLKFFNNLNSEQRKYAIQEMLKNNYYLCPKKLSDLAINKI